jgi:hypothetical protein
MMRMSLSGMPAEMSRPATALAASAVCPAESLVLISTSSFRISCSSVCGSEVWAESCVDQAAASRHAAAEESMERMETGMGPGSEVKR